MPQPPINPSAGQVPSTPSVVLNSPEFKQAVADAVAAALATKDAEASREVSASQASLAPTTVGQAPVVIQRTSIDTTQPGPDDVTIRFNRFCTMAGCGYQRGQEAGFPRDLGMGAVASGTAILVHDPRLHGERIRRAA